MVKTVWFGTCSYQGNVNDPQGELLQMKTHLPSHSTDGFQIANALFKVLSAALVAATLLTPAVACAQSQAQSNDWPKQQNPDLIALRRSSSPAERKLSFNLFLLTRQVRKAPLGSFASMV